MKYFILCGLIALFLANAFSALIAGFYPTSGMRPARMPDHQRYFLVLSIINMISIMIYSVRCFDF